MKLKDLLRGLTVLSATADMEMEITGVSYDSRQTLPGDLFVAVTGFNVDGHAFVGAALGKGAVCAVCQHDVPEEIPCVVVDVMRVGPASGMPTLPAQGDVMQARWGSHGDRPAIVLCPSTVRETFDLTVASVNISEQTRVPVILLSDAVVGHLRERVELPEPEDIEVVNRPTVEYPEPKRKPYHMKPGQTVPQMAPFGKGQRYNITGLIHDESGFPTNSTEEAEKLMYRLMHKISDRYDDIVRSERLGTDDAEVVIVCYGGTARAALSAMEEARSRGVRCGLFRPVTIWPFPERELSELAGRAKRLVVAEHNYGQLVLEVERIAAGRCPVDFIGRYNGTVITPQDILQKLEEAR